MKNFKKYFNENVINEIKQDKILKDLAYDQILDSISNRIEYISDYIFSDDLERLKEFGFTENDVIKEIKKISKNILKKTKYASWPNIT